MVEIQFIVFEVLFVALAGFEFDLMSSFLVIQIRNLHLLLMQQLRLLIIRHDQLLDLSLKPYQILLLGPYLLIPCIYIGFQGFNLTLHIKYSFV